MRKIITLTGRWCEHKQVSDWRQHPHHVRHLKRLMRKAQNTRRRRAKSKAQKKINAALCIEAYQASLYVAERYLNKARATAVKLEAISTTEHDVLSKLKPEGFMKHALRQIGQTKRRVLLGEVIPHAQKAFSIFQLHTEWLSKGKAGVPVELGVKVCILEDQYQFILHHKVMQQQTDDQVAVSMVTEAKKRYPRLSACSFDKGFHSTDNQGPLKEHLELVALSRKGKLSQVAQGEQQSEAFIKARRAHSAVESAINAIEVHGLDKCPDHGINGFRRYVALAVVARNIRRIGAILWQQEQKRAKRKKKCSNRAPPEKRAA